MRLFDFSLLVGSDPYSPAEAPVEALVSYLDSADAGGVVTSLTGVYYDYEAANNETLEIAGCDKRLLPGFVLDPRRPGAIQADLKAAAGHFAALVLFQSFPGNLSQGWPLDHPAVPLIFEKASEAGLPIIVHTARGGEAGALSRLALAVDVAVVALGIGYGATGEVIAAAATVSNLFIGTALFAGFDNIETLVRHIGAERLVYNSGEPRFSHGGALRCIESAPIDERARQLIVIGNARRIFGERM